MMFGRKPERITKYLFLDHASDTNMKNIKKPEFSQFLYGRRLQDIFKINFG